MGRQKQQGYQEYSQSHQWLAWRSREGSGGFRGMNAAQFEEVRRAVTAQLQLGARKVRYIVPVP